MIILYWEHGRKHLYMNRSRFSFVMMAAVIFGIADTNAMEWIVNSNDSYSEAIRNVSFGDTVTIEVGLYVSCDQIILASNITIQASIALKVVIDCNRSSSHFRIFGENVRFQGITFVNGFSDLTGGCVSVFANGVIFKDCQFKQCRSIYGGGIYLSSAVRNATLFNLFVSGCKATFGGGLYADRSVGMLILGHLALETNTASDSGGGMYMAPRSKIEMNVRMSEIRGNSAEAHGGGFYGIGMSLSFSGENLFVNNVAKFGGGFFSNVNLVTFESNSSTVFKENSGSDSGGAMILVGGNVMYSQGYIRFEGIVAACPFHCSEQPLNSEQMILNFCSGNDAGKFGGAISMGGSSLITSALSTMVFEKNICRTGGGGSLHTQQYASLDLDGSFQFRNNSCLNGAGLNVYDSSGILRGRFLFEGKQCLKECIQVPDQNVNQETRRARVEAVQ
jgi:hypothetical protein